MYWLFMLGVVLISPLIMIVSGLNFTYNPPQTINAFFGYRTNRSMNSKEAWDFAHKYFGKIWLIAGIITLMFSLIFMLFLINKDNKTITITSIITIIVQMIPLIGPIIPTERALKQKFDHSDNQK
ncbi:MAG: SdpI family protein [Candidatus ainarchaeum sp.]|nr:SdpI family protein [Candidatus ainarchaeum sp.]